MARQYNTERKSGESLEQQYRRLAKVADQRLVRLEQASQTEHYKQALQYSYSEAMVDIKKWSGSDATRFNTNLVNNEGKPLSEKQIVAKINDIKKFIEKDTSTKSGITNVYKKRAKSINEGYFDKSGKWIEGYGTNFTWQEMATFYERGQAQAESEKYGSKTYARSIGVLQRNKNNIIEAINKANEQVIKLNEEGNTSKKALSDNWEEIKVGNITISKNDIIKEGNSIKFKIKAKGKNSVINRTINELLQKHNYNINDILGY